MLAFNDNGKALPSPHAHQRTTAQDIHPHEQQPYLATLESCSEFATTEHGHRKTTYTHMHTVTT
jgi:hypothetical protein